MDFASTVIALAMAPATVTGTAFGISAHNDLTRPLVRVKTETGFHRETLNTEWFIDHLFLSGPDDLTDTLRNQAFRYSMLQDGWDGEGSSAPSEASFTAAMDFIGRLPAGLTLPGIMISSEGEIGFYWQLQGGYADISFDEYGMASFYSRPAISDEVFLEDLAMATFTRDWFFQQLGEMDAPALQAA
ncbi:hypothetical protein J2W28_000196 [Variovorax boronicumulans]|uniref:hypothetical protein n=1 Tax=Variovorax boronicumulans TaxID=436515 RepID=UPI00278A238C|nr:hypothetical protein [Variovorax boronicumulans]MDP9990421.1 hypothetical protein [Variovorax boronicumulans]MDQ0001068.1 hypothetical protein [Variovorax boronicumulans]